MSNFYISKMESDNATFWFPITIAFKTATICSNKANWLLVQFTINPICAKMPNSSFKENSSEPPVINAFLIVSNYNITRCGWFNIAVSFSQDLNLPWFCFFLTEKYLILNEISLVAFPHKMIKYLIYF